MSDVDVHTGLTTVKVTERGGVAVVALNRPEVRNSFHPTMIRELTEVFASFASRADLTAVILRGEGKSFCAGADLAYMRSMAAFTLEENQRDSEQLFEMFWTLRACPQPLLGLVHGHAMGGALGLLALCDVAAGVTGTQFCFSEVRLGLAPAVISPFVMEKMDSAHVRRYLLTAEVFGVEDAKASGLVAFHGASDEAELFINQITSTLRANGPEAVRATKALMREVRETPDWPKRRAITTKTIAERRVSAEGQEGLRSFFEKRAPRWGVAP